MNPRSLCFALLLGACLMNAVPARADDPDQQIANDKAESVPAINSPNGDQHIEGRIAFLKTELMITPDQNTLWNAVAEAMRADVQDMQNAEAMVAREAHGRNENAIQYLQHRAYFASLRANGEARFLAAMKPLYENMSSKQKHAADTLLAPDGEE